jgi:hypothetical protein
MYVSAVANVSGSLLSFFVSWSVTLKEWLSWTQPHLFSHQLFSDCFCLLFSIVCAIFIIRHNSNSLYFILSTSFDWFYNIPWMMKKLKGFVIQGESYLKLPTTCWEVINSEKGAVTLLYSICCDHTLRQNTSGRLQRTLHWFSSFQMKLKCGMTVWKPR